MDRAHASLAVLVLVAICAMGGVEAVQCLSGHSTVANPISGCNFCRKYLYSEVQFFECVMASTCTTASADDFCCGTDLCNCRECTMPTSSSGSSSDSDSGGGSGLSLGAVVGLFVLVIALMIGGILVYNAKFKRQAVPDVVAAPAAPSAFYGTKIESAAMGQQAPTYASSVASSYSYSYATNTNTGLTGVTHPTSIADDTLSFVPSMTDGSTTNTYTTGTHTRGSTQYSNSQYSYKPPRSSVHVV